MHTTSETSSKDGNKTEAAQKVDNLPPTAKLAQGVKKNLTSPNMLDFSGKKLFKNKSALNTRL